MMEGSNELSMVEKIRANADLVVSFARDELGQELTFDEAGVRWLDGFIQRQHEGGDPAIGEGLINMLGSFLGECIIRNLSGEWACRDGRWGVRFDDGSYAFPFTKVGKQLENGLEGGDSVLSFFTAIPALRRYTSNRP